MSGRKQPQPEGTTTQIVLAPVGAEYADEPMDTEALGALKEQLRDDRIRKEVALRHSLQVYSDGMFEEARQAGIKVDYLAPAMFVARNALSAYEVLTKAVADVDWPSGISPPQYFASLLDDIRERPIQASFGISWGEDVHTTECNAAEGTETMNEIRKNLGYAAIAPREWQDG